MKNIICCRKYFKYKKEHLDLKNKIVYYVKIVEIILETCLSSNSNFD